MVKAKEEKKVAKVSNKTTKKVDNKKKVTKKEVLKKGTAKVKVKKESIFKKIGNYFRNVKLEMTKVKWPTKKEMLLYSGTTLGFIVIFALFFTFNDVIISAVKQLVR